MHMETKMADNKNPRLTPAAVAHQAIGTLILNGGLPPEAIEHLRQASDIILSTPTTSPDVAPEEEGGIPLGESVAASKRRANGEEPEERTEEDPDGDEAPPDKMKGDKSNPLSGVKRWASSPTKDDDEPEEKPRPKPKASVTFARGKASFLPRGRR